MLLKAIRISIVPSRKFWFINVGTLQTTRAARDAAVTDHSDRREYRDGIGPTHLLVQFNVGENRVYAPCFREHGTKGQGEASHQ